jgi:hypothetical protein
MVDSKDAWVEFPGFAGFEVQVVNLARKEVNELRKRCLISKFDRNSSKAVNELDEEKFVSEFAKATVKSWKGLKLKYLEELILIDMSQSDPESQLPFSQENAVLLVSNSTIFDAWLNDTVFALENFRDKREKGTVGKTGEVV